MRFLLILSLLTLLGCKQAARVVEKGQLVISAGIAHADGTTEEMERLGDDIPRQLTAFTDSPRFTEAERVQLEGNVRRFIELLNKHPNLAAGNVVDAAAASKTMLGAIQRTHFEVASVDARDSFQTGVKLRDGDAVRVDVLDGDWSASSNTDKWPLQPGTGYPDYSGGLFIDWRLTAGAPMGALVARFGDQFAGTGHWTVYRGHSPSMLELVMNDDDRNNNRGRLQVRYAVRKAER